MRAAAEVEARASAAREASTLDEGSKQSMAMEVDNSFTPDTLPADGHRLRSGGASPAADVRWQPCHAVHAHSCRWRSAS